MSGCRAVFHVAALYRFWASDPAAFYDINVGGTKNILAAASESGVERLVYTSTVGTLGLEHVSGAESADERSFPDVRHLYGSYKRSKYVAEHEVLRAIAEGLPASLVLPTFPVGPGDRAPTPTGKLVLDFLNGRIPGFVNTVLNVAHVDDVAAGQVLALEGGRTGRSYILGGENLSLQALLDELASITGLPEPRFKVPRSLSLAVAALSEAVEGRLLRRHPSVPLEAARMSTSQMAFDDTPGAPGAGLRAATCRRGARGLGALVCADRQGRRPPAQPDPLVLGPVADPRPGRFGGRAAMGHTGRRGAPIHLHHARPHALLPAGPRGPQGHQPVLLPGSQDRRHRVERVGQVVAAADHGRRGRRVHGRGPPHAGVHRRLPPPGAAARHVEGRRGQRGGGRRRGEAVGRPVQRGLRRVRRTRRRHRRAARRAGGSPGRRSTPPVPGSSTAPSRSPWTHSASLPATPTSGPCRAASAAASRSAGCCCPSPTCSSSTSRPTTSTRSRLPGWSGPCRTTRAPWSP